MMKRIALALALLAATAACNGTTPTEISPSSDGLHESVMGSGMGRDGSAVGDESEDDGTMESDGGYLGSGGGRTGLVGSTGG